MTGAEKQDKSFLKEVYFEGDCEGNLRKHCWVKSTQNMVIVDPTIS